MKTIMHITEVSSGGVLPIIVGQCNGIAEKYKVVFVYGTRFDTPRNISELFNKNVELIHLDSFQRKINLKSDLKTMKALSEIVQKYNPDVVHMHSSKAGFVGRFGLLRYKGIKLYTPHGYSFLKPDNNLIKKIIYFVAEKILAATGSVTVACGKEEYLVAKKVGRKTICLENALDTKLIDEILDSGSVNDSADFSVYTVGRIGPQKNPQMFNELAKRFENISFYWIGDGDDRYILSSPNITVTGVLNRADVIRLSQKLKCYVSCSPSEGLPIALLEAMYLKKICVVTNVSGNNELIDDSTGYLYDNLEQCTEIIRKIIDDRTDALEKSTNARQRVIQKYDMSRLNKEYIEILETIGE